MRISIATVVVWLAVGGAAAAQTAQPERGYVEVVAQSAFGNVTSQSYGGEIGVAVAPRVTVFVDAGHVRDAAASTLGSGAQLIAGYLSQTQGSATYSAKQPVTFGVAGVRYHMPVSGTRVEPYLSGGAGVARVKNDVSFTVAGNDVTSSLSQFGVTLGTDLSGSETKAMLSLGAGVAFPVWRALVVDVGYRYGRIFTAGGLNVNRAGVGLGVRF